MLDQQPVRALAAVAIALHAHEYPAALQALAGKQEFQLALAQLLFGREVAHRQPEAAVPELHRSAAVLALRNRAFEVAVVEGMVLDFDCKSLVLRREGRAARDRPGLEHAIELQAQVVVQPPRRMLLNHETQLFGPFHRQRAARLRGLGEIALAAVGRQFAGRHERASRER
jgi:hypothetical protein